MTTKTTTKTLASSKATALMSVLFVAMLGASTVFLTGFAHSQTLHDAAHDVRHSSGFPCH
ncbi:MAG: CbtB domain-containing protein [Pseudomonadota bacterium]